MQQIKFGRTGLLVSELALGAMQFGWRTTEQTSGALLDAYAAAGGNFIQTTACGWAAPAGADRSEEIVGAWLRRHAAQRDRLVLSTRLAWRRAVGETRPALETIRRQCEESLRRLGVSHLDLLVFDWDPALVPLDEVFRALDHLIRAGKLRYVGAAGFPVWRFMEALGRAARIDSCRFESFQADYSLLDRAPFEPEAIDLARDYRVGLVAQSPLAGGFLTGSYRTAGEPETARSRRLRERYGNFRGYAVLATLEEIAAELGATPAQVALAWLRARAVPVTPLVGVATVDQLQEAVGATRLTLTPPQLDRLAATSARWPGIVEPTQTIHPSR